MQRYKGDGEDTIVLAGAEYGSGSTRDWAAMSPMLLVSSCVVLLSKELEMLASKIFMACLKRYMYVHYHSGSDSSNSKEF